MQHKPLQKLQRRTAIPATLDDDPMRIGTGARMKRQNAQRAKASVKTIEKCAKRLGPMDDRHKTVAACGGRHKPAPLVECAIRHLVSCGLEIDRRARAASLGEVGWIGYDVRECSGAHARLHLSRTMDTGTALGDVQLDDLDARREVVAKDILVRDPGQLRLALDKGHVRIGNASRHTKPSNPNASTSIQNTRAAADPGAAGGRKKYSIKSRAIAVHRLQNIEGPAQESV